MRAGNDHARAFVPNQRGTGNTSEKVLKALEALEPPRMLRVTRNMPKSWGLSVTLGCLGHQVCLGYRPNPEHPQEPWMVPENPPAQRENV